MSTANAWTYPAPEGERRPDAGWPLRARLGFGDIITLLWGQKWLMAAIFIVIFAAGLAFALTLKTEYTANAAILVKPGDENILHPRAGGAGAGMVSDNDERIDPERVLLGDGELHRRVVERLGVTTLFPDMDVGKTPAEREDAVQLATARFSKNVAVQTGAKMPTIPVSYTSDNPQMAARALNALIEEYLDYRRAKLLDPNGPALLSVKASREQQLAEMDDRVQAFMTVHNISDFDGEQLALRTTLTAQEQQRTQINAALQESRARLATANGALGSVPAEVPLSRDIDLSGQQSLTRLYTQRAETLGAFLPGSPRVQAIEDQIAGQTEALRRNPAPAEKELKVGINPVRQSLETDRNTTQNSVAGLQASFSAVTGDIARTNQRLRELASLEPEYRQLLDQRKNLQDSVSQLDIQELQSSTSNAIARSSTDNIRVLSYASPPIEGSSKRKLVAGVALVFAAFTAICAGLLSIFLKPGLPTATAAGRTLDLPVLAMARVKA